MSRVKRVLMWTLVTLVSFAAPGATLADSKSNTMFASPITQTHTLFFNTQTCSDLTAYAYTNWNERMQRTPGSNREIDSARYRTVIDGLPCGNYSGQRDTGIHSYYPSFGGSNDITWTLTLNWPYVAPAGYGGSASSQKVYYTRGLGGPVIQTVCNNVKIYNGGDFCSLL